MSDPLSRYRSAGHRTVDGWLLEGAIAATCDISDAQRARGITGPVCEIGVHHGRLFILMVLLNPPTGRSLAIDLFEMQSENTDRSGKGDRERFVDNLRACGCDPNSVVVLAENSLRVTPAKIIELCGGRPRLFSVDGGHTAEVTKNDLRLASASVCEGGVVILDDYFNPALPAVSEGAAQFMREAGAGLVPVLITSNKFFLAKGAEAAASYRKSLMKTRPQAKLSTIFGTDVVCDEPHAMPSLRQLVTSHPRWLRFRQTHVGKAVLQLKRLR